MPARGVAECCCHRHCRNRRQLWLSIQCRGSVSFTGSSKVGSYIGQLAMKHFKKPLLELGGNSAFIKNLRMQI
ncbi:aldehyde dehydrogenase family protein [Bacillus subtilis]|uniref:aldehyde dehydrogenase family protein n=1 Tax=Bacillus subtilis TaxID=1423 RepID=UPI0037BF4AE7